MKITKQNIDAHLHEAADTLDHVLGQPSSLQEPGKDELETGTPPESTEQGDLGPVVVYIQKIPVFKDVDEAIILSAVASIPSLKGKAADEIVKLLTTNGALKSQLMNKVGELADRAEEEARNA